MLRAYRSGDYLYAFSDEGVTAVSLDDFRATGSARY